MSKQQLYVLACAMVAGLGGLLFGFDTAVISGANADLQRVFDLNNFWLGFTVSSALVGTVIGALTAGDPSDRYGRRFMLFVLAVLFLGGGGPEGEEQGGPDDGVEPEDVLGDEVDVGGPVLDAIVGVDRGECVGVEYRLNRDHLVIAVGRVNRHERLAIDFRDGVVDAPEVAGVDVEGCVEQVLDRVGPRVVLGTATLSIGEILAALRAHGLIEN